MPVSTQGGGFAGALGRSALASDPARSRGRQHRESDSPRRTAFQRDRDRILHSTAFRRLSGKTQVFLTDEGDHFRTRLTHTLEVAQVARSIARALGLDEDLTEAIALGHDLGHPPFGHAGERALDAALAGHGGFDHNAQSLRVVTRLERRYPDFDGLNLTWETLEGLVKHNGPLVDRSGHPLAGRALPQAIVAHAAEQDLLLWNWPGLEAQVAAVADDIAYDAHDIDDGLRAGLLTLERLRAIPLLDAILSDIAAGHPRLERSRVVAELVRRLIGTLIEDVIAETQRRAAAPGAAGADDVRAAPGPTAGFSASVSAADAAIKALLARDVYRSPPVAAVMGEAEAKIADLYALYAADPEALPEGWRAGILAAEPDRKARRIADFLAGMTDRFALAEHARLFDRPAEIR